MGKIEDKIKEELFQTMFEDMTKVYEFIDNRFSLDEKNRDEIIGKLHQTHSEISEILRKCPLS